MGMESSRTRADLRTFLGASGYLQKHIAEYHKLAEPLRRIVARDPAKSSYSIEHEWTTESITIIRGVKSSTSVAAITEVSRVRQAVRDHNGLLRRADTRQSIKHGSLLGSI